MLCSWTSVALDWTISAYNHKAINKGVGCVKLTVCELEINKPWCGWMRPVMTWFHSYLYAERHNYAPESENATLSDWLIDETWPWVCVKHFPRWLQGTDRSVQQTCLEERVCLFEGVFWSHSAWGTTVISTEEVVHLPTSGSRMCFLAPVEMDKLIKRIF